MKKIYAFLAASLFAIAPLSARELVFYVGEEAVTDGATIEYQSQLKDMVGIGGPVYQWVIDPEVSLFSDMVVNTVSVTATCTNGYEIQLCAGGACENGESVTKEGVTIQQNQKLPMQFEYAFPASEATNPDPVVPEEIITEFSAVDVAHPNVKAAFTLIMRSTSGVTTVLAVNDAFRAVAGGVEYNFDAPTAVEIYSLAGEKVISATLDGAGLLSTDGLAAGIYAYKAGNTSGKIYIR